MTDAKSEKENRDPAKKRSIIRGIVIVFLVILLILTFPAYLLAILFNYFIWICH